MAILSPSNTVCIGQKEITLLNKPYIIAEAGGNHNGSLSQAVKLVEVAADCRSDAVKFAISRADTQYPPNSFKSNFNNDGNVLSAYDLIKQRELPYEWLPILSEKAKELGIDFLASSFDFETTDALTAIGVPAYKIASYECTHIPLIKYIAKKNKPIIISTGLASFAEIKEAVDTILDTGNTKIVLMHCLASYPAPIMSSNLSVLHELAKQTECLLGMSDHSLDPFIVPMMSVSYGARVIEKHLTLSRLLPGADHPFALEPSEFKQMVNYVHSAFEAVGEPVKRISKEEEKTYELARRTVFSKVNIAKGEIFDINNTIILRKGGHPMGLSPRDYQSILGRRSTVDISSFAVITEDKIDPTLI